MVLRDLIKAIKLLLTVLVLGLLIATAAANKPYPHDGCHDCGYYPAYDHYYSYSWYYPTYMYAYYPTYTYAYYPTYTYPCDYSYGCYPAYTYPTYTYPTYSYPTYSYPTYSYPTYPYSNYYYGNYGYYSMY